MKGYKTKSEMLLHNVAIDVAMNEFKTHGNLAYKPSEWFAYISRRRYEIVALLSGEMCRTAGATVNGHVWEQTLGGGIVCERCSKTISPTDVINNLSTE